MVSWSFLMAGPVCAFCGSTCRLLLRVSVMSGFSMLNWSWFWFSISLAMVMRWLVKLHAMTAATCMMLRWAEFIFCTLLLRVAASFMRYSSTWGVVASIHMGMLPKLTGLPLLKVCRG